jgi:ribonucleoside-diphosphate reductase beta chain
MITVIGRDNCPWCVKVLDFLKAKNIQPKYVKIKHVAELIGKHSGLTGEITTTLDTVPQVYKTTAASGTRYEHIGGYEDTVKHFGDTEKKKTVFNADNTGHETGDYPLFFGEQLGFIDTINMPYPILDTLYQEQLAQIWNEFEVDLSQDRQDMLNAKPEVVSLMVKTILWQHLADSIASRSITGILLEHVTNTDLEAWYNAVALFETIHARTYSHIIKQTFPDPNQALREGYADLEVVNRSNILKDCFDDLANLPPDAPLAEKEEKVYLAIIALYCLEGVNFMGSFAVTFGIAETSIMQGIAQDVSLICRDEMLHSRGGAEILKIEIKKKPEVFKRLAPKIKILFDDIIKTEMDWTDYLFSEGRQVIGVNPKLIKEYINYMSQPVARVLDIEVPLIAENPLPYMDNYIDSSKIQMAAQEIQLTSYLVNSVLAPTDMAGRLAKLRKTMV